MICSHRCFSCPFLNLIAILIETTNISRYGLNLCTCFFPSMRFIYPSLPFVFYRSCLFIHLFVLRVSRGWRVACILASTNFRSQLGNLRGSSLDATDASLVFFSSWLVFMDIQIKAQERTERIFMEKGNGTTKPKMTISDEILIQMR
jgi:hypothetical protein